MDQQAYEGLIQHVFDVWVNPEIERRASAGLIKTPLPLFAVQIICRVGANNEVRLNSEVKAVFECKPRRAISAGEGITEKDIEEITNIFLTSEDEDAGHITVIFVNGHAHLAFDFQYNTRRIKELLEVAREFIDTAGLALNAGNQRAFVENQFRKIQKSESCMGLGKGGG